VLDAIVLWLPAAVYLGLEGRWGEALGVAGLGTFLVRGIENFLYPVLVNHRVRVPSVSIFVALLGGLLLFGWSGLVLGPVILTVTIVLLEICAKRIGEPSVAVPIPERPGVDTVKPKGVETLASGGADSPEPSSNSARAWCGTSV
jgi:AI-2E family transporter